MVENEVCGIRFACSTICFRHASIDVALEEIRTAGFESIDLAVVPGCCPHFDAANATGLERDEFVQVVRSSGLAVTTVSAAPGFFNQQGVDPQFVLQAAAGPLKLAALLSAGGLNVGCALPIEDREAFPAHAEPVIRGLKLLALEAARLGLNLHVELAGGSGLCTTLDEADFVLERVGERNVYALIDAGTAVEPETAVGRFAGRIGHVRLRDGTCDAVEPLFEALLKNGYSGHCALWLDGSRSFAESRRDLRTAWPALRIQAEAAAGAALHGS